MAEYALRHVPGNYFSFGSLWSCNYFSIICIYRKSRSEPLQCRQNACVSSISDRLMFLWLHCGVQMQWAVTTTQISPHKKPVENFLMLKKKLSLIYLSLKRNFHSYYYMQPQGSRNFYKDNNTFVFQYNRLSGFKLWSMPEFSRFNEQCLCTDKKSHFYFTMVNKMWCIRPVEWFASSRLNTREWRTMIIGVNFVGMVTVIMNKKLKDVISRSHQSFANNIEVLWVLWWVSFLNHLQMFVDLFSKKSFCGNLDHFGHSLPWIVQVEFSKISLKDLLLLFFFRLDF